MSSPTVLTNIMFQGPNEDRTVSVAGGCLHRFTANAALLVGDAVYLQDVNTVDKSTTAANYVGFVGFVETGDALGDQVGYAVGTAAAAADQAVLVRTSGIARAIVGATGFTAGTNFNAVPSAATAGRVIPGTTADQRLGTVLTTQATAGAEVRILISRM